MAKIVIVDDNTKLRQRMQEALTSQGHTVVTAQDGHEGLRLIRSAAPDLVVSDIFMPDMDGIELIQEVQASPDAPLVLAISAGSDLMDLCLLGDAHHLGASGVLAKPFRREDLLDAVDALLALQGGAAESDGSTQVRCGCARCAQQM